MGGYENPSVEALATFWDEWLSQDRLDLDRQGVRRCTHEGVAKSWIINVSNATFAHMVAYPRYASSFEKRNCNRYENAIGKKDTFVETAEDDISGEIEVELLAERDLAEKSGLESEAFYKAYKNGQISFNISSDMACGTPSSSGELPEISCYQQDVLDYLKPYEPKGHSRIAFELVEAALIVKGRANQGQKGLIHGIPFLEWFRHFVENRIGGPAGRDSSGNLIYTREQCATKHRTLHGSLLGKRPQSVLHQVALQSYGHRKFAGVRVAPVVQNEDGEQINMMDRVSNEESVRPVPRRINGKYKDTPALSRDAWAGAEFELVSREAGAAIDGLWGSLGSVDKCVILTFVSGMSYGSNSAARQVYDISEQEFNRRWLKVVLRILAKMPSLCSLSKGSQLKAASRGSLRGRHLDEEACLRVLFCGVGFGDETKTLRSIVLRKYQHDVECDKRLVSIIEQDAKLGGKNRHQK